MALSGGCYLAYGIMTNNHPPLSAANIHGVFALSVLLLVGYKAFTMNTTELWIALGLLGMASLGGLYLVSNHKKDDPGPSSAIIIHGLIAVSGIALIIISIW